MRMIFRIVNIICAIIISWETYGQFKQPIVPANVVKYKNECAAIAKSGYKQRRDISYKINEGKVTTEKHTSRLVNFNSNGSIKEFVYLYESGRQKAIVVFEYFSNGLPKSEGEFHPTGEFLKQTNFSYSFDGHLQEKTALDQYGNVLKKTKYIIDGNNNTVTEKKYPFPSVVKEKNIMQYSSLADGRLIRYEKYDGETILKFKKVLFYENNNLIKEEYFNPAGKRAFIMEYIYDTNNHLSKTEKVLSNGTRLNNAIYHYNSSGLLIGEITYNRYGKMKSYYKYSYE